MVLRRKRKQRKLKTKMNGKMKMKMKMKDSFEIRPYTKKELALLYFPLVSDPHVAVNRLMSWIARCRPLLASLQGGGYRKTAKWFTSCEVRLIVEHLGEPSGGEGG